MRRGFRSGTSYQFVPSGETPPSGFTQKVSQDGGEYDECYTDIYGGYYIDSDNPTDYIFVPNADFITALKGETTEAPEADETYDRQKVGEYGTLYVNSETGKYVFVPDNEAIKAIKTTVTQTFTFTVDVGSDSSTTKEISFTFDAVNDPATIYGAEFGENLGSVVEDNPDQNVTTGQLRIWDVDTNTDVQGVDQPDNTFKALTAQELDKTYGTFTFISNGDSDDIGKWTYTLDNTRAVVQNLTANDTVMDTLTVYSLDGTDSETITVLITGETDLIEFGSATSMDSETSGGNIPYLIVNGTLTLEQNIQVTVLSNGTTANTGTTNTGVDLDDYTLTNTTVTIAKGVYNGTQQFFIDLTILSDSLVEADETIHFQLVDPSSGLVMGDADNLLGAQLDHTYTIENDDQAVFSVADKTQNEEVDTMPFAITLSNPVDVATTITVNTSDGTAENSPADGFFDYTQKTETIEIAAGEQSATFTVDITDDTRVEDNETYTVEITNPLTADQGLTRDLVTNASGNMDVATGTIVNTDTATVSLSGGFIGYYNSEIDKSLQSDGGAQLEGDSGDAIYRFTATLSDHVQNGFTLGRSSADGNATAGTDYTDTNNGGVLTFAGNESEQQYIDIVVHGDNTVEGNEYFSVSIADFNNLGMTSLLNFLSVPTVDMTRTGEITNDDSALFSISSESGLENEGPIQFTVTLSNPVDIYSNEFKLRLTNSNLTPSAALQVFGNREVACRLAPCIWRKPEAGKS